MERKESGKEAWDLPILSIADPRAFSPAIGAFLPIKSKSFRK